jgi:putative flippase GtrA
VRIVVKQISKFFIIGVSAVLVDLTIYYMLSSLFGLSTDVAKGIGFLTGAFYTYHLNKLWTWRNKEKSDKQTLLRFALIYSISFIANILINKFALLTIPGFVASFNIVPDGQKGFDIFAVKGEKLLSFIAATGFSAFFNFLGQKFFVFKEK